MKGFEFPIYSNSSIQYTQIKTKQFIQNSQFFNMKYECYIRNRKKTVVVMNILLEMELLVDFQALSDYENKNFCDILVEHIQNCILK